MICIAAGVVFSSALKLRCEQLRTVISLIDEMSSRIRCCATPLSQLITELNNESVYRNCGFLKRVDEKRSHGVTVQEAWISAAAEVSFITGRDRDIIADIGGRLGDSDTDGQLTMLSQAVEMLSRSLEEAEADCTKRSGAILRVWALCGIGAGMVII